MAKKTEYISTARIGQAIDEMKTMAESKRRYFERKWYDNNFFDDGKHFRYVSRTTGKIVDLTDKANLNVPTRAIPKASRQIRGIANLLMQPEYIPVIYPEKVSAAHFNEGQLDPMTGQVRPDPAFIQAGEEAKRQAKRVGQWIEEEWKDQHLVEKLIQMILLAQKNSVGYIQIWADPVKEALQTQVYDAFDIYLLGNLTSIYDSPFIIKTVPMLLSEIKANEMFDEEMAQRVTADEKYSASDVKEAYLQSRYGMGSTSDNASTALIKEGFMKEYLCDENWAEVKKLGEANGAMEGKNKGDMVIRHAFTASGITLLDEYLGLREYPFADFRMEPGPIYQTPQIERFIPANKTLDTVISRLERYINTMTVGIYQKRKGENFEVTNRSGAQIIEYEATPLQQMPMVSVPSFVFNFIEEMNSIIEEQGSTTSALGQLPQGVKSGVAIESLKATEYANLKIATLQLKETIRNITERMIEIASDHFRNPQTVMYMEKGEPQYFDIIGKKGIEKREELNRASPNSFEIPQDVTVIDDTLRVNIEIESGLGFTMEGKKETMQQILNYFQVLIQQGMVSTEVVKQITGRFLEVYQYGATQEFLEAFDKGLNTSTLSEEQLTQMKVAMAEVIKDTGVVGPETDEKDITKSKIGTTEALQDLAQ